MSPSTQALTGKYYCTHFPAGLTSLAFSSPFCRACLVISTSISRCLSFSFSSSVFVLFSSTLSSSWCSRTDTSLATWDQCRTGRGRDWSDQFWNVEYSMYDAVPSIDSPSGLAPDFGAALHPPGRYLRTGASSSLPSWVGTEGFDNSCLLSPALGACPAADTRPPHRTCPASHPSLPASHRFQSIMYTSYIIPHVYLLLCYTHNDIHWLTIS